MLAGSALLVAILLVAVLDTAKKALSRCCIGTVVECFSLYIMLRDPFYGRVCSFFFSWRLSSLLYRKYPAILTAPVIAYTIIAMR